MKKKTKRRLSPLAQFVSARLVIPSAVQAIPEGYKVPG